MWMLKPIRLPVEVPHTQRSPLATFWFFYCLSLCVQRQILLSFELILAIYLVLSKFNPPNGSARTGPWKTQHGIQPRLLHTYAPYVRIQKNKSGNCGGVVGGLAWKCAWPRRFRRCGRRCAMLQVSGFAAEFVQRPRRLRGGPGPLRRALRICGSAGR